MEWHKDIKMDVNAFIVCLNLTYIALILSQWIISSTVLPSIFQISVNAEQVRIELEPPDKAKPLGTVQQKRRQKMQQK